MKIPKDWNDCPELHELIAEGIQKALDETGDEAACWHVEASSERGSYGERGTLTIRGKTSGGTVRVWALDLYELKM